MTNRYKKHKTFPSVTVHQSYIATLPSSYVQTPLVCVKTCMAEYSCDSLANSPPRPSNCPCAQAGRGRVSQHAPDLSVP